MAEMNRRSFLFAAAAATAATVISLPVLQAAEGPTTAPAGGNSGGPVHAGTLADFDKDGVSDKFAKTNKFFIIRQDGKLYAVSSICSHARGAISVKGGVLTCGKHPGKFDLTGTPTGGPPKRPLARLAISKDGDNVVVDTSKSFTKDEWEKPGAYITVA